MKKYVISLILCVVAAYADAKVSDNVVIQNLSDVYKFIPDKGGTSLDRVEHTSKTTFRAKQADVAPSVLAYYDDFIKIDKTSADKKLFGPYIPDDIFFSDSKACVMIAEINKAGATKDISYKRIFTRPELFTGVMVYEPYEVESGELIFEIPVSLAGKYSLVEHHFPEGVFEKSTETKNNTLYVKYTYKGIEKPESYGDAPSLHLTAPSVIVLGHFKDTDELYRYLYSCLPENDPGAGEVAAKAREITKDCSTDAERIKAVTDYVHNTVRYVAVENGELGHRPDVASEVLRKAYGDCKGSATLIKEMLCSLGIDARHVWLGTDVIDMPWTEVPNVSSGNHMIAAVVEGDSITYIDGTMKYSSPGELGVSESGVQTIIEGNADTYIIGETPPCDPAQHVDSASWVVNLIVDKGALSYEGGVTLSGLKRKGFVAAIDDAVTAARRSDIHDVAFGRHVKGGIVRSVTSADTCGNIVLRGIIEQGGVVKNAGEQTMVDINPAPNMLKKRFMPSERKVPGMVETTEKTIVEITLNVPEGMVVDKLPQDASVSNQWLEGNITTEMSADGRSVKRKYTLISHRGVVDTGRLKNYNEDIKQFSKACAANIVLRKAE